MQLETIFLLLKFGRPILCFLKRKNIAFFVFLNKKEQPTVPNSKLHFLVIMHLALFRYFMFNFKLCRLHIFSLFRPVTRQSWSSTKFVYRVTRRWGQIA